MSLYRDVLLGVAGWGPLERFARRRGLALGANRFVAGESLADGVAAAQALVRDGTYPILDVLGEYVTAPEDAAAMADRIHAALRGLSDVPEPRMASVKPTQVGLGIDPELGVRHLRALAETAREASVQLTLDMEDHPHVDATLDALEALHDEGHHHVSTVLQSYLLRTPDDVERLLARDPVPTLRLVKGAYKEPASVAYPNKSDVDAAYARLLDRLLEGGGVVHVATHDEALIAHARTRRDALGLPPDRMTLQLLYGVKRGLQRRLVAEGERVGIYLPFGADWYGYFTRRLAERPANLGFVMRGLLG